ncbi:hypothetical protein AB9K35_18310 [Leisingera sp. XS_AS12]|uniref:hypothetical protein n=1 Tax=Leisingera sp. XS_AS12 TaxID=3241294 RepID=UPI003514F84F
MLRMKGFLLFIIASIFFGVIAEARSERTVTVVAWDGPEFKFRCDKMAKADTPWGTVKTCIAHSLILKNHKVSLTMKVNGGGSADAVVKVKDDCKAVATVAGVLDVVLSGKVSESTGSVIVEAFHTCVEGHEIYYKAVKGGAEFTTSHEESFDSLGGHTDAPEAPVVCTVTASQSARIVDRNGWGEDVVIAVDNGFIYWIAGDALYRARHDGPLVAEMVDGGGWKGKSTIVVENNVVYWVSEGDIFYANLANREPAKTLNSGGWYEDTKFAVDGEMIYWLDQQGYLYASKLEQPLIAKQLNSQNYSDIDGLTVNAGNIFWQIGGDLIQRGACFEEEPSVVNRGGFDGGVSVAVGDGKLFWTAENNLYSIPLDPSN